MPQPEIDWYEFDHAYWMARNAIQNAVVLGKLCPGNAMRIKGLLRDVKMAALKSEKWHKVHRAESIFRRLTKRYSEVSIHAG